MLLDIRAAGFLRLAYELGRCHMAIPAKQINQEAEAAMLLFKLGITPGIKGYRYMLTALQLIADNPEMLDGVVKKLYPAIAERHSATPEKAERCMRHAVIKAWEHKNVTMESIFPGSKRPAVAEFLGMVAEVLRLGLA
jgi:two-component system response regulator (stage 0 sporulation protein A)